MVHGAARITRFRLRHLAAFLQDTAARPTIVQFSESLLRAWRNGRRSRLRIWSRKGWRVLYRNSRHGASGGCENLVRAGARRRREGGCLTEAGWWPEGGE